MIDQHWVSAETLRSGIGIGTLPVERLDCTGYSARRIQSANLYTLLCACVKSAHIYTPTLIGVGRFIYTLKCVNHNQEASVPNAALLLFYTPPSTPILITHTVGESKCLPVS